MEEAAFSRTNFHFFQKLLNVENVLNYLRSKCEGLELSQETKKYRKKII